MVERVHLFAYNEEVIMDLKAYQQLSEKERWEALRRMTPEESIAIGEALLTSEVMNLAEIRDKLQEGLDSSRADWARSEASQVVTP